MDHLGPVAVVGSPSVVESFPGWLNNAETVRLDSIHAGLSEVLRSHPRALVWVDPTPFDAEKFLQNVRILDALPDGVCLLNRDLGLRWWNQRLATIAPQGTPAVGVTIYDLFPGCQLLTEGTCAFRHAWDQKSACHCLLQCGEKTFRRIEIVPILDGAGQAEMLLAVVRDTSAEVVQRQKLAAIYQAGLDLGDLGLGLGNNDDMTVDERIELLKQKILHYTENLLEYDTVEIRILDKDSGQLIPLLAVGMDPQAASRQLFADPEGNGVTGYVAATGRSYLCQDILTDPLYLLGMEGARSSLTVPLILHDKVLGTFNVESPKVATFTEDDLQFLELFGREVAVALNTLDLLVAEQLTTATASTTMLLREVAGPVDEILNDAAWILDCYIGHEPNVAERLQRILRHTRTIRSQIHKVGESFLAKGVPGAQSPFLRSDRPALKGKRVLVVDHDESVRRAAHELLGRHGCEVETAHDGAESILMNRQFQYDMVLADIRLPDMSGFDVFQKLRELQPNIPVILMTGFGYDPAHSIVKARQAGLKSVLYKPFRLEQLLTEVERAVTGGDGASPPASN